MIGFIRLIIAVFNKALVIRMKYCLMDVFAADQVESLELYPKFVCDKVMVPPKKPEKTTEL